MAPFVLVVKDTSKSAARPFFSNIREGFILTDFDMAFLVFYITHPDESSAQRMAGQLLERRLVACANIFPISSAYWWQGAIQREGEWVSIVKTRLELENALEQAIQGIHPYDTPCILRWEARANAAYEQWIEQSTRAVSEVRG